MTGYTLSNYTRSFLLRPLLLAAFVVLCVAALLAAVGVGVALYLFTRSVADSYDNLIDDMLCEVEDLLDW